MILSCTGVEAKIERRDERLVLDPLAEEKLSSHGGEHRDLNASATVADSKASCQSSPENQRAYFIAVDGMWHSGVESAAACYSEWKPPEATSWTSYRKRRVPTNRVLLDCISAGECGGG